MKNYNKQIILIFTLLVAIALPSLCIAQGGPGDPGGGGDPGVPFDGGASILIASGVAYGAKKYRERKRKWEESGKTES